MVYAVTPNDVAAVWRPLSTAEESVAEVLLLYAEVLLLTRRPDLPAKTVAVPAGQAAPAGMIDQRAVVAVLADMVQAVLRNPDVQSSIQLTSDGSVSASWTTNVTVKNARPRLMVNDEHLLSLQPAAVPPVMVVGGSGWYSVPYQ